MKKQTVFFLGLVLGSAAGLLGVFPAAHWASIPIAMAFLHLLGSNRCVRLQTLSVAGYALGFMCGGLYWLTLAIYHPPVNSIFAALSLTLILLLGHAGWYVFTFSVCRAATRVLRLDGGIFLGAVMAIAWTAAELLRSVGWWAMPWGLSGTVPLDNPAFASFYPVLGAPGVAGLHWVLAALLLRALTPRIPADSEGFGTKNALHKITNSGRVGPLVAIGVWAGLAWNLAHVEWTQPTGDALAVRLVHTEWPGEEKQAPGVQLAALRSLQAAALRPDHADLTVFPELFLAHPAEEVAQPVRQSIVDTVRRSGGSLVFGTPLVRANGAAPAWRYNGMLQIDARGDTHLYAKTLLLPFSEFLPETRWLAWAYPYLYRYPEADMVPGAVRQPLFQVGPVALGMTICSELAYPGQASVRARDANLLVNASSDAWIPSDGYIRQAHQIARVRAAEARKEMVRANNVGISAFIDARGGVRSSLHGQPGAGTMEVQPRSGLTPFVRLAAWVAG